MGSIGSPLAIADPLAGVGGVGILVVGVTAVARPETFGT